MPVGGLTVKRVVLRFHPTNEVIKRCTVPFSTSLNAAALGGGVVCGIFSWIFFAPAAGLDVPCDTSPGGLFRAITPRSLYNTPRRLHVRVVVDNIDPATRGLPLLKPARAVSGFTPLWILWRLLV
jgi:hypothetical protein